MKPSRAERSAVWQRTRTRPLAGLEERAALITSSAAKAIRALKLRRTKLYSRERGRLAQLGERLPYKQEVACSSHAPPTRKAPLGGSFRFFGCQRLHGHRVIS